MCLQVFLNVILTYIDWFQMESFGNLGENDPRTPRRYRLNSQLNSRVCVPNCLYILVLQLGFLYLWFKNAAMWQLAFCTDKRLNILLNKVVREFIYCINSVTFLTGPKTDPGLLCADITAKLLFYFWWQRAVGLGSLTVAVELQQYDVRPTVDLKAQSFCQPKLVVQASWSFLWRFQLGCHLPAYRQTIENWWKFG